MIIMANLFQLSSTLSFFLFWNNPKHHFTCKYFSTPLWGCLKKKKSNAIIGKQNKFYFLNNKYLVRSPFPNYLFSLDCFLDAGVSFYQVTLLKRTFIIWVLPSFSGPLWDSLFFFLISATFLICKLNFSSYTKAYEIGFLRLDPAWPTENGKSGLFFVQENLQ